MDLCIACTGANQLETGQAGKVTLKCNEMQWQLSVSGESYFKGGTVVVHPLIEGKS